MNDEVVVAILKYVDECLSEPRWNWPKSEFDHRSYSRWAAFEILGLIMDRPFVSPTTILDEFVIQMCYFAHLAKENDRIFIFAIDTAEDIRSILM